MTNTDHRTRVGVYGAGSWGTALAAVLARNGHHVRLWGRDLAALKGISQEHCNRRYLPDAQLPASLEVETDFDALARWNSVPLLVIPSHAFVDCVRALARSNPGLGGVAWATKGFEPGSGRFLHEVVGEVFGSAVDQAVVTGPTFAKEVALAMPSALTVHSGNLQYAQQVAALLHGASLRAYSGNDIAGAELGGAMKNVLAVATGIADGMGLGLNARAGLITRGLNEMMRLNAALGGRIETIMGLAGLGDLVLTCTGDLSRNRRLGLALGRGVSIADAVAEIGQVVESVQTADEVMRLARRHELDLPIAERVQAVLHKEITPAEGLQSLLAREQKPEYPKPLFGTES
ncbi:MAG: NAD(P)-dependent glycerol-3-phosphate dehydrogenase [Xanthomonadales bacterium]|nr:NAD(P)-dependent glycerol-3-phosphate dehydrogenase [Xanthomonadales bacterium]